VLLFKAINFRKRIHHRRLWPGRLESTEFFMNIKTQLTALLQEAEVYREQGLTAEAVKKYNNAIKLVHQTNNIKNKDSLLSTLQKKIQALDESSEKATTGPASPELSSKAQDLIKNLFAFSKSNDEDSGALEGAVALAKFGQFDRALTELMALLDRESIRVEAAKNIIRCHLSIASSDEAIDQYHQWFSSEIFLPSQLETVRGYLDEILKKRGIEAQLPSPLSSTSNLEIVEAELDNGDEAESEEEFLDITSIGITFETGPQKGRMIEFDVNFQSGNMLSLIVSKTDQELIRDLKAGAKLQEIQFFSPIAIFNGAGVVSSKTEIKSGPKQGDYCLDIRIISS
jgi:tetratricopeptide (TPR) repeat protein